MKRYSGFLCAIFLVLLAGFVQADVIYNNFGLGDDYYTDLGWAVGFVRERGNLDEGFAFRTLGQGYYLERIELAVGLVRGPNELDVWLMTGSSDEPDTIIESFHFSDKMGSFRALNPPLVADSVLNPLLEAGEQYWLVATAPSSDTLAAWNYNSIGDLGLRAFRIDLGDWTVIETPKGAFRISGRPATPEPATVSVDIKPGSCPNPLNTRSRGVLPVAILGTWDFDVSQINSSSIRLLGIAPLRSNLEDVARPFEPFIGKEDAYDCNDYGPDGYMDLTLKFDTQEIVKAIGDVNDRDVLVLPLTGVLLEELGGTQIQGEDVVVILKKGKKK